MTYPLRVGLLIVAVFAQWLMGYYAGVHATPDSPFWVITAFPMVYLALTVFPPSRTPTSRL